MPKTTSVCVWGGGKKTWSVSDLGLTNEHQPTFSQPTAKTRFLSSTQIWTLLDCFNTAFWGETPCVYFNGTPKSLVPDFNLGQLKSFRHCRQKLSNKQKAHNLFSPFKSKANPYMKLFKDWDQFVSSSENQYSCTKKEADKFSAEVWPPTCRRTGIMLSVEDKWPPPGVYWSSLDSQYKTAFRFVQLFDHAWQYYGIEVTEVSRVQTQSNLLLF